MIEGPARDDAAKLAMRLALAVTRLRTRLREAAGANASGLSISQLAVLQRVISESGVTASSLANAERVSQQAIAQILTALRSAGLVVTAPDPADGRKSVVTATESGRQRLESMLESRDTWLVHAVESRIAPDELAALETTIDLLERLAQEDRG